MSESILKSLEVSKMISQKYKENNSKFLYFISVWVLFIIIINYIDIFFTSGAVQPFVDILSIVYGYTYFHFHYRNKTSNIRTSLKSIKLGRIYNKIRYLCIPITIFAVYVYYNSGLTGEDYYRVKLLSENTIPILFFSNTLKIMIIIPLILNIEDEDISIIYYVKPIVFLHLLGVIIIGLVGYILIHFNILIINIFCIIIPIIIGTVLAHKNGFRPNSHECT